MRLVDRPFCRPMRCAALPHIGQTMPTRWIDTGSELHGHDNHVYLSEVAVTEAARLLGWAAPGELRAVTVELAKVKADLVAERKRCAELTRTVAAVELVHRATSAPAAKPKREKVPA